MTTDQDGLPPSEFGPMGYKGYKVSLKLVREGAEQYDPVTLVNSRDVYEFMEDIEDDDDGNGGDVIIDIFPPDDEGSKRVKYVVDDVEVSVVSERVQYYGKDGKLITESLRDYTRKNVIEEYESLDSFLRSWSKAEKKKPALKVKK